MCGPYIESDVAVEEQVSPEQANAEAQELLREAMSSPGTHVVTGMKAVRYHESEGGRNADRVLSLLEEIGLDTSGEDETDTRIIDGLIVGAATVKRFPGVGVLAQALGAAQLVQHTEAADQPRIEQLFRTPKAAGEFLGRIVSVQVPAPLPA